MGSHGPVHTLVPEEPFIRGDGHGNRVMGLHTAILSSLHSRSRAPHRGDTGSRPGWGVRLSPLLHCHHRRQPGEEAGPGRELAPGPEMEGSQEENLGPTGQESFSESASAFKGRA